MSQISFNLEWVWNTISNTDSLIFQTFLGVGFGTQTVKRPTESANKRNNKKVSKKFI